VEAARVPQQLLGELFLEKGLITPEELQEALEEQKSTGERIGQILVKKGFVSGPVLTTVLAEQLGVDMEKQEGFGSGLWSEIKRRHPRVGREEDADEPQEPIERPEDDERRLALIDELDAGAPEQPVDDDHAQLENLRQQLRFASTRLDEERAGHKGTLRLLEESRRDLERLGQEVDDWRERAAQAADSQENEQAAAQLAELEATVAELRNDLAARERELAAVRTELAAGADVQTQLGAEVGRLEEALRSLGDQHNGSKDAIAALTAQVDEQRASGGKLTGKLEQARAEVAAFEATIAELRNEVSSRDDKAQKYEQKLGELKDQLAAGEDARSHEAAARVAAETELARAQSDALALSHDLEEARGAHVAARHEVGRLESRCAELEPLEALLAQANADVAARTHLLAELTAELEAVRAELAERPAPPPVEEPPATHLVFLRSGKGYSLAERPGSTPDPGAYADVDDVRFLVSRIGPSPLPADRRRCAYLEVA
jgi:predicted  nucleic acid-binding Zn-ribbon protein